MPDTQLLQMALIGYEAERQKIEASIAAIRKQVDGHATAPSVDGDRSPKRDRTSPYTGGALVATPACHEHNQTASMS